MTGVALNKTELSLKNGQSETLKATVIPFDATDSKVIWSSSNNTVCMVDQNGKVTAVGNGTAVVTAKTHDGNYTAECSVNVNTPVTGIMLNKTQLTLAKGSKETLIATVTPSDASQQEVSWFSSNPTVCTVDSTGTVSAFNTGTVVIYAKTTDGGFIAACIVTVVIPVTGITLNKTELTLENGSSESLTATVTPSDASDQGLSWSSSSYSVCTVDQGGKLTAVGNGAAVITVTTYDGAFTAKCNVNVKTSVKGITLNKSNMNLIKGSTESLIATVTPTGATQKDVLWFSSDPNVCTVDLSGKVTAVNAGTSVVFATTLDGGYTAVCTVTVTVPVTGVTLNKEVLTLENGTSGSLTATVNPSDATDQKLSWSSSDVSVCTVSEDGVVTAIGNGTAVISVTTYDGGFTANCSVKVVTSVTGVTLNKSNLTLIKGSKGSLIATVSPAGASQQDVIWLSSDENVCTVDSAGNITALNAGTTDICVTTKDGNYTAKCTVTVIIPVSDVVLNKTELTLEKGTTELLTATVSPADATNSNMAWSSSNKAVCAVDQNGKLVAVANGNAVITVMTLDGGYTAECSVMVITSVTGITLNKASTTLVKGTTETLTATITPEDASQKDVLWSSSDENVCTVDSLGCISAINAGSAVITVTTKDGDFTATCAVTVVIPVTGITLSSSALSIIKGNRAALQATILPADATNKSVTWTSSDNAICSVDQSGVIIGTGVGTATITATTQDGGFTVTCAVEVKPNTYTVSANAVNGHVNGTGIFNAGTNVTLTAVPDNYYEFVNWTNSSGAVIGTSTTYTIYNLNAEITMTANFKERAYQWTYTRDSSYCSTSDDNNTTSLHAYYSDDKYRQKGYGQVTYTFTEPVVLPAGSGIAVTIDWGDFYLVGGDIYVNEVKLAKPHNHYSYGSSTSDMYRYPNGITLNTIRIRSEYGDKRHYDNAVITVKIIPLNGKPFLMNFTGTSANQSNNEKLVADDDWGASYDTTVLNNGYANYYRDKDYDDGSGGEIDYYYYQPENIDHFVINVATQDSEKTLSRAFYSLKVLDTANRVKEFTSREESTDFRTSYDCSMSKYIVGSGSYEIPAVVDAPNVDGDGGVMTTPYMYVYGSVDSTKIVGVIFKFGAMYDTKIRIIAYRKDGTSFNIN